MGKGKFFTLFVVEGIILLAFLLRVIPNYDSVFPGNVIQFTTVDAYYHMYVVDGLTQNFPHLSPYLPYLGYPGTQSSPGVYFFDWLLAGITWLIGLGSPVDGLADRVGAYYPAILGALTVIPVYFIGKTLNGRFAGVAAAGLIAIMPGEFLGRSILGSTDQHVMETLLTTTGLLFLLLAVKHRKLCYGLLSGLFFGLYYLTWAGALLFGLIILIYMVTLFAKTKLIKGLILTSAIGLAITFVPDILRSGFGIFYPSGAGLTTAEMQPILSPGGNFTLAVIVANYGFAFFLSLVALLLMLILTLKRQQDYSLVMVWSLVILAAMLGQRRFAYYFAVNVAVLTGFLIGWLAQQKKSHLVLVLLMLSILPFGNTSYKPMTIPPDWQESLIWLKENTPDPYGNPGFYYQLVNEPSVPAYAVLSWWDYGYWITRVAHRVPTVNPSQDAILQKRVASILTDNNDVEILQQLEDLKVKYIVIDDQMVSGKFWAITLWADRTIKLDSTEYNQTLMVRLFNGQVVEGIRLVYNAKTVRIFEVVDK